MLVSCSTCKSRHFAVDNLCFLGICPHAGGKASETDEEIHDYFTRDYDEPLFYFQLDPLAYVFEEKRFEPPEMEEDEDVQEFFYGDKNLVIYEADQDNVVWLKGEER